MPLHDSSGPYQRVWEAFQRSEATSDGRHDTPRWRAHTGHYAACVVRIPPHSCSSDLQALRGQIAGTHGVRVHPDYFLHIMLQELGFLVDVPGNADEITIARLEEFVQAAIEPISRVSPFPVSLGGANAFQDAVFLEIGRGHPLVSMHERLFDLAALPHIPDYPYLPHCTVAHFDGTTDPQEVVPVLEPWRHVTFGEFTVAEIEIVTLDPGETYPELQSYAVIPLQS